MKSSIAGGIAQLLGVKINDEQAHLINALLGESYEPENVFAKLKAVVNPLKADINFSISAIRAYIALSGGGPLLPKLTADFCTSAEGQGQLSKFRALAFVCALELMRTEHIKENHELVLRVFRASGKKVANGYDDMSYLGNGYRFSEFCAYVSNLIVSMRDGGGLSVVHEILIQLEDAYWLCDERSLLGALLCEYSTKLASMFARQAKRKSVLEMGNQVFGTNPGNQDGTSRH